MEPYENMYIGQFIFYLGYLRGKEEGSIDSVAIQLFQQTPADSKVGDLLGNFEGANVIIEFKRNQSSIKQEIGKTKWENLKKVLTSSNLMKFKEISKNAHFLGYPVEVDKNKFTFKFVPYIDFVEYIFYNSISYKFNFRKFCKNFDSLLFEDFYEKLFARKIGVDIRELRLYLNILNKTQNDKDSSGFYTGGLFINITKDGKPVILYFKDYRDLAETIKNFTANRNNHNRESINGNGSKRKPRKPRMRM